MVDGADEANLSSKPPRKEEDRKKPEPTRPGGGRISEGGDIGGDSVGFLIGEQGTVYRQRLIVAARGRVRDSNSSDDEVISSRLDNRS